jgi:filamentous hemagglutinin family protein
MIVNQLTDKVIINWDRFDVGSDQQVQFVQPRSDSIALVHVTGFDLSSLSGQIMANGRVFLVNPSGIVFGPSTIADIAGLLATTFNIKNNDFMAGKYTFAQDPTKTPSYVINKGEIRMANNGFAFLVGPAVSNEGTIIANLGNVLMGAGNKLTADFFGGSLVTFAVEGKVVESVTGPVGEPLASAVSSTGVIRANGGLVVLTALSSGDSGKIAINVEGTIEANEEGRVVFITGNGPVDTLVEIGQPFLVISPDSAAVSSIDITANGSGVPSGTIIEGSTCTLRAGNFASPGVITLGWVQVSGPPVTLYDPSSTTSQFVAPLVSESGAVLGFEYRGQTNSGEQIVYSFALAVTDNGLTDVPDNLILFPGWNFISLPMEPSDTTIGKVLAGVASKVAIVWGYDNETKVWTKWKPQTLTSTALTTMETGKGYWIYMTGTAIINMTGWAPAPTTVHLFEGWNLVGYSGPNNKDILTALDTISSNWSLVWNWSNQEWKAKPRSNKILPAQTLLDTFGQTRAYWIKMQGGEADWVQ